MLTLSEEELDWLSGHIPDAERSPKGGRPPTDKRQVIAGVFWVLDNGAKWKDFPSRFGPKSTVHRWFLKWVNAGVFESSMRAAGRCVEDTGRFRLYECFIDGTFSKAKSGGDGIGCTRVGKGVKIMILVDAKGCRWRSAAPRPTPPKAISSSNSLLSRLCRPHRPDHW